MKQVLAKLKNKKDWSKQFVDDTHYDEVFRESVIAKREDGSTLMVLLKGAIDIDINARAWGSLKKYNPGDNRNRSTATGTKRELVKRMDGTLSKMSMAPKGWGASSGIMGYFERTVMRPYCHACTYNEKSPEKFSQIMPLVEKVNSLYKEYVPEKYAFQKSFVDKTPKDYMIGDSVFTTLTINKNFRTSCHKDAGDLPGAISCMSVIREGAYRGGILVLPDYRIAADLQMGDLILFDPHEFHGNTQIVPLTPKAVRCSIVYYYREMMHQCLPPEQELERVKKRKQGDHLFE